MNQVFEFLRFVFVGLLNTVLDASVLNLLLLTTNKQELFYYSLFKGISFTVAVVFSYFMNQSFVFKKSGSFKLFVVISIVGAFLNVSSATLGSAFCLSSFTFYAPRFILCANLGFLLGAGVTIIWNFLGYKFFVFKDKEQTSSSK